MSLVGSIENDLMDGHYQSYSLLWSKSQRAAMCRTESFSGFKQNSSNKILNHTKSYWCIAHSPYTIYWVKRASLACLHARIGKGYHARLCAIVFSSTKVIGTSNSLKIVGMLWLWLTIQAWWIRQHYCSMWLASATIGCLFVWWAHWSINVAMGIIMGWDTQSL